MHLIRKIKMGDGIVFQGEGASQVRVTFRLTIFKPFVGEIIAGKLLISSSSALQSIYYIIIKKKDV